MVVNFKVCEISRGECKLVRTSVLIKKNNQNKRKLIQIFILIKKKRLGHWNRNEICMFRKVDFSREIS